jgi:hypothetical protein
MPSIAREPYHDTISPSISSIRLPANRVSCPSASQCCCVKRYGSLDSYTRSA